MEDRAFALKNIKR